MFAYIGVEVAAAAALEVRPENLSRPGRMYDLTSRQISVRFCVTWSAFLAFVLYFVAGLVMTFNVPSCNPLLPGANRTSLYGYDTACWPNAYNLNHKFPGLLGTTRSSRSVGASNTPISSDFKNTTGLPLPNTQSGFVLSAWSSLIPGMDHFFNAVLLMTAISSANTNLYVASRTLFALARKLDGKKFKWFSFFGHTNRYKVPVRAMVLSCMFIWLPWLYLDREGGPRNGNVSKARDSSFADKHCILFPSSAANNLSRPSMFCLRLAPPGALSCGLAKLGLLFGSTVGKIPVKIVVQ